MPHQQAQSVADTPRSSE